MEELDGDVSGKPILLRNCYHCASAAACLLDHCSPVARSWTKEQEGRRWASEDKMKPCLALCDCLSSYLTLKTLGEDLLHFHLLDLAQIPLPFLPPPQFRVMLFVLQICDYF